MLKSKDEIIAEMQEEITKLKRVVEVYKDRDSLERTFEIGRKSEMLAKEAIETNKEIMNLRARVKILEAEVFNEPPLPPSKDMELINLRNINATLEERVKLANKYILDAKKRGWKSDIEYKF